MRPRREPPIARPTRPERSGDRPVEAGAFAGVTRSALLMHPRQQHIAVAVDAELLPVLGVSRGVALAPELAARPAPVDHPALGDRLVEGLAVRPRQHQDVAVLHVLHDHGDQPTLVEAEVVQRDALHRHRRTGIPRESRCSFTSRIVSSPSWKREAASTASACPSISASAKCCGLEAPPDATTGTRTASAIPRSSSRSKPWP